MPNHLYIPHLEPHAARLLTTARQTNDQRDAADRKAGAGAPTDCPLDVQLRTAMDAIAAGLNESNATLVAEGLAMLQDAELEARQGQ